MTSQIEFVRFSFSAHRALISFKAVKQNDGKVQFVQSREEKTSPTTSITVCPGRVGGVCECAIFVLLLLGFTLTHRTIPKMKRCDSCDRCE